MLLHLQFQSPSCCIYTAPVPSIFVSSIHPLTLYIVPHSLYARPNLFPARGHMNETYTCITRNASTTWKCHCILAIYLSRKGPTKILLMKGIAHGSKKKLFGKKVNTCIMLCKSAFVGFTQNYLYRGTPSLNNRKDSDVCGWSIKYKTISLYIPAQECLFFGSKYFL